MIVHTWVLKLRYDLIRCEVLAPAAVFRQNSHLLKATNENSRAICGTPLYRKQCANQMAVIELSGITLFECAAKIQRRESFDSSEL